MTIALALLGTVSDGLADAPVAAVKLPDDVCAMSYQHDDPHAAEALPSDAVISC